MLLSLDGCGTLGENQFRGEWVHAGNVNTFSWHVRFEILVRYAGRGDSVHLIHNAGAQGKCEGKTMINHNIIMLEIRC